MFKYPSLFILIFIVSCTPKQPEQAAQSSSTEDISNVTNETPEPIPEKKKKEPLASASSQAQQKSSAVAVSGKPKINGDSLNSIQPADSPSVPDENGTIDDLRQVVQANNKDEVEKLLKLSDVKSHINDLIVTPARQNWMSYVPEERQSLFFKAVKNSTGIEVTHYHSVAISLSEEEQNLVDSIKDRARMRKTMDSLVKSKMDPHTAKQLVHCPTSLSFLKNKKYSKIKYLNQLILKESIGQCTSTLPKKFFHFYKLNFSFASTLLNFHLIVTFFSFAMRFHDLVFFFKTSMQSIRVFPKHCRVYIPMAISA